MRIQHNIMAMSAYRNYTNNVSAMKKNLEKLSSGYKINRAGDDAAGLAISEKMRAQITGLETAQKNAKDGISLVQTAEGALTEVHDMLNRMVELATMSANGTYDDTTDRAQLQKELDQLKSEINRIADSANFNGIKLLNGDLSAESISAVGELDSKSMVDGTAPTAGGKAVVTVTLGSAAPTTSTTANKLTAVEDEALTFDGTDPADGTGASFTFKVAAANTKLGTGTGTSQVTITPNTTQIDALATAKNADGVLLKDIYDISVKKAADDSVVTGWDATDKIQTGDVITLTARAKGANDAIDTDAAAIVTGQDGDITTTPGTDQGIAGADEEANYSFDLDTTKLQGGQKILLGGKEITVSAKAGTSDDTTLYIGGLDAAGKAAAFKTSIEAALDDMGVTVGTDDGNGKFGITMEANPGTGVAGNKGWIRVETADGNSPISNVEYNIFAGADGNTTAKMAQATFQSNDLKTAALKNGAEITVGDKTIKIVNDETATGAANEILEDEVTSDKLSEVFETLGANVKGLVEFDVDEGTITITAADSGSGKLDDLEGTNVTVKAAPAQVDAAAGKATSKAGGLDIEIGKTKVSELNDKEIAVNGKQVKLGELFEIKVTGKDGNAITGANAITDGASISFTAKQVGELDDAVMNAITYEGEASTSVTPGWDEGQTGAGNNTHYELNIATDNAKLVGGASFSFGTGDNARTFDITYDADPTKNGTIAPDKDEVGGGRITINLSASMTDDQKAEAIKKAVGDNMDAFNVKTTVADGKVKLELDAKDATETTNYGGVRFSSEAGAFSDGVYKAYNAFDGGTEGTYAQVTYSFDPSKLKAGDKLTIGDTTINVGEKTFTEKNADGTFKVTLSEEDAQKADKLIAAFESAGYQSGQLTIGDGKLTITGTETGQTAQDLSRNSGKVSLSATRALISGGLKLQIGETADSWNQLVVGIQDMHAESLGLDKVSVADQDSAQAAIDIIKNAINQVSDVRGTLGATQNRLDHTINNLSVMTENIQDAESTIRDVDVAEEMMAYTKNNILIQSAQAMLAQANQVPQGVLQLLQ